MLKNSENNGTEKYGLVTPTPRQLAEEYWDDARWCIDSVTQAHLLIVAQFPRVYHSGY